MKLIRSFKYAFNGLSVAFKEQLNLRIHFFVAAVVIGLAAYFRVTLTEWLIILLTISFVISLELINSSIEKLTDLVTQERNPLAGKVKDIAAAAVLVASVAALIVGVLIFWNYIF